MSHRPVARPRLLLELLEARTVPASVTARIAQGVLTVTGTPGPDAITVRQTGGQITVDGVGSFSAAGLTRVVVDGSDGDDTITLFGAGVPYLALGGNGNDHVQGGPGNDTLVGGNGNDWLDGGGGDDLIGGDAGNDVLYGGAGNDSIWAGPGDDYVNGGGGNDYLDGQAGRDQLYGGDGYDRYRDDYAAPRTATGAAAAIAARNPGEVQYAVPGDLDQQIAQTCSYLAALAAVARRSDLAARVRYDFSDDTYFVPLSVGGHAADVGVRFDGTWTDNDPSPGMTADGGRDYWPILYQRAYLQSQNVDAWDPDAGRWAVHGTAPADWARQLWRYPDVALRAATDHDVQVRTGLTDADRQLLEDALRGGRAVIANTWTTADHQSAVDGTGLVFGHTYTVMDAGGGFVTLRNPWGVDTRPELISGWTAAARTAFTLGDANDGLVRVSWDVFRQAFAGYATT